VGWLLGYLLFVFCLLAAADVAIAAFLVILLVRTALHATHTLLRAVQHMKEICLQMLMKSLEGFRICS
jgi:hypothetical protein